MKKHIMVFLVILLSCFFLSPAPAVIYQWTDKNGNTVFSDSPPSGVDAKIRKDKAGRIEKSAPNQDIPKPSRTKSSTQQDRDTGSGRPAKDISVIMYMTSWCPYCKKAKELINSLGVSLVEYDIDTDKGRKEEMKKKSGGATMVPLIDIEGTIVSGYNPEAIREAVKEKKGK